MTDVFANIVDDPARGAPLARLTPIQDAMQEAHDVWAAIRLGNGSFIRHQEQPAKPTLLNALKTELMWAAHNLIAHPFSEITHWLGYIVPGLRDFGLWVHDITVPPHAPNTGRG